MPLEALVPAIAVAELAAGVAAARTAGELAIRRARLKYVQESFEILPFDAAAADAYGAIYAAARAAGRKTKRRAPDYLIAAIAAANAIPLYTKNPKDVAVAKGLVEIIGVPKS